MRFLLIIISFFAGTLFVNGQMGVIHDFVVKQSLVENHHMAIVATDSTGTPNPVIQGTYQFSINGFKYTLNFQDGSALTPQPIEGSAFVLIKHKNVMGSIAKLFFVYKNSSGIKPFSIPWYWLILIPVIILSIGYIFKKLLYFAIILLVGMFVFNYSKGLDLTSIFETLTHGVTSLMGQK